MERRKDAEQSDVVDKLNDFSENPQYFKKPYIKKQQCLNTKIF
jgi:hypothetical protein